MLNIESWVLHYFTSLSSESYAKKANIPTSFLKTICFRTIIQSESLIKKSSFLHFLCYSKFKITTWQNLFHSFETSRRVCVCLPLFSDPCGRSVLSIWSTRFLGKGSPMEAQVKFVVHVLSMCTTTELRKAATEAVCPAESKILAIWSFTDSLPTPALRNAGQICES